MTRIIIDPGHGGSVQRGRSSPFGGRSAEGTLEKHVNFELARRVASLLGPAASLTRSSDENRSLGERIGVARQQGAAAFLSLHAHSDRRPPETWIHSRARASSMQLANSVQQQLAMRYGGSGPVQRSELAVLDPEWHAADTAACLIETNALSSGRYSLDDMAGAIAQGVQGYLHTRSDDRVGRAWPRGLLSAPARRSGSTAASALAKVATFRGGSGSAWHSSLDRATVANRLADLIHDPNLVLQGSLNLCGPAALLHIWLKRDPEKVVDFASSMFETGVAHIGNLKIAPGGDLKGQDYAAVCRRMGTVCPAADWMIMSAIRDSENALNDFEGTPEEDVAGITSPEELTSWLEQTGLYSSVSNEANWALTKGWAHASHLTPTASNDIVLLVNAQVLGSSAKKLGKYFPNHFIVLYDSISSGPPVTFRVWTWGDPVATYPTTVDEFDSNYYGAITATI